MKSVLLFFLVFFQTPATAQTFRNTISGQIRGMDGKPASGVRVAVVPVLEGDTFSPLWPANQTATTDSKGNYILRDVDPGQYYLLAGQLDAPTYFPGAKEVSQARKITFDRTVLERQDFRLVQSPGVDIRGRLANKRRIGATPSILLWRRDARIWPRVETPIHADGSFVFHGVPPGVYDLSLPLYSGGALLNGTEIHVQGKHVSIRLVEVPAAAARGRVEIEGGGTVPQMTVEFKNRAGRFLAAIRTLVEEKDTGTLMLPAGEYRVSFAQFPADYRVVSFTYGNTDLLKGSVKVAGSLETFNLKLARVQPSKLRRISGRVLGVEHVSTPSFVALSNSSLTYPVSARASLQSDGRYEFTGLTAGTYTLWIGDRAFESLPRTVTLGETDIDDVDFNIPALRQLQGRIVLNGGGALPNFGIVFVHETGASRYASRKAGAFTAIVPEGDWAVRLDNLPQDAFQVQSMMFGNADLLRSPLRIAGTSLPELRITLAPLRTGTNAAEVAKESRVATSSLQAIGVTVEVEGDFPKPRASLEFERISPDGMGDLYFTNEYFKASLPPGDYQVRVKGFPKEFFRLKSLDFGSVDLLRERLHVADGFNPQIILTFAGIVNAPWGRIRGIAVEAQSSGAHLIGQGEAGRSPADSSGRFEFSRVLPGSYWVNTTSFVGAGAWRVLVTDNKAQPADVSLPAVREIRGRVVVDGGNPLPYAVVQVSGPSLERPIESVVDADGAFQMTVPDGEHDVQLINLSAPYRTKSIRWGSVDLVGDKFRLASATEDEIVATLDVIPTALWPSVSGDVVGVTGLPASAKIVLVGGVYRLSVRTTMNPNGGFIFPRVPPDIYTLRLDPPIYGMPDRTVVVEDRDVRAPDLVLPEQRMITTRIRVDGDAQKPRFTFVLKGSDGKGFQFLHLGSNLPIIRLGRTDFECIGDVCGRARLGRFLNEPSVVSDNSPETFRLRIPDGEYRLELQGGPAVRSVTYGAVDLLKDSLRLSSANPAEIVITFAP